MRLKFFYPSATAGVASLVSWASAGRAGLTSSPGASAEPWAQYPAEFLLAQPVVSIASLHQDKGPYQDSLAHAVRRLCVCVHAHAYAHAYVCMCICIRVCSNLARSLVWQLCGLLITSLSFRVLPKCSFVVGFGDGWI